MMARTQRSDTSFATLFKKYRLRSEIETLSQFGDLLAQEGLVYEPSLFTHWQKGDREPKERRLLLKVISIFVSRGGIKTVNEANKLLGSISQKELDAKEITDCGLYKRNIKIIRKVKIQRAGVTCLKLLSDIFNTKYLYWIVLLFVIQTLWYLKLQWASLANTGEAYAWGILYSLLPLSGFCYGVHTLRQASNNSIGLLIVRYLSFALFGQWFGLSLWNIYNILGIVIPYPSLADIGYLASIPFYSLAALTMLHPGSRSITFLDKKYVYLSLPLYILMLCYSVFLHATGFDFSRQARVLLDFVYPSGGIIPIFVATYAFLNYRTNKAVLSAYVALLLIVVFVFQFASDYLFIYAVQIDEYVNGGINDYIYSVSYTVANLAIITFSQKAFQDCSQKCVSFKKIRRSRSIDHIISKSLFR
jgi:hypothetical protein